MNFSEELISSISALKKRLHHTEEEFNNYQLHRSQSGGDSEMLRKIDELMNSTFLGGATNRQQEVLNSSRTDLHSNGRLSNSLRSDYRHHHRKEDDHSISTVSSSRSRCSAEEYKNMQNKLSSLQETNKTIGLTNGRLLSEADERAAELLSCKNRIKMLNEELGGHLHCFKLTEKVSVLKEELYNKVSALEQELVDTKELLDQQRTFTDEANEELVVNETVLQNLKRELEDVNTCLEKEIQHGLRVEKQRDDSLASLEQVAASVLDLKNAQKLDDVSKVKVTERKLATVVEETRLFEESLRTLLMKESTAHFDNLPQQQKVIIKSLQALLRSLEADKDGQTKCCDRLSAVNRELEASLDGHSKQVNDLEKGLSQLKQEVIEKEVLAKENEDLRVLCGKQTEKLGTYQMNIEKYRLQVMQLEVTIDNLDVSRADNRAATALGNQVSSLKRKLAAKDVEYQSLNMSAIKDDVVQKREVDKLREESKILKGDQEKMSDELRTVKSELQERRSSLATMEQRLRSRNDACRQVQRDLEERNNRVRLLEEDLANQTKTSRELRSQLAKKESQITSFNSEVMQLNASLKTDSKELAESRKKLEKCKADLKAKSSCIADLKKMHDDKAREISLKLMASEEEAGLLTSRFAVVSREAVDLREQLTKRDHVVQELQRVLGENTEELAIREANHREAWSHLTAQNRRQCENVRDLEAVLEKTRVEAAAVATTMNEQHSHVEHLRPLVDRLTDEKDQLEELIRVNERRVVDLTKDVQERQQMILVSNNRVNELEDSQCRLEQELSQLKKTARLKISATEQDLLVCEDRLDQACQELEAEQAQLSDVKDVLRSTQQHLKLGNEQAEVLQKQIEKFTSENRNFQCKIDDLEKELDAAHSNVRHKQAELDEMERQIKKASEQSRTSLEKLQETLAELAHLHGEMQTMERDFFSLQREADTAKKQAKEGQIARETVECEMESLKKVVEVRTSQIKEVDNALGEHMQELNRKSEQVTQLDLALYRHQSEKEEDICNLVETIKKNKAELQFRDRQIFDLEGGVKQLQLSVKMKDVEISNVAHKLSGLESQLQERTLSMTSLDSMLTSLRLQLSELTMNNKNKTEELALSRKQILIQIADLGSVQERLEICLEEQSRLNQDLEQADGVLKMKDDAIDRLNDDIKLMREALGDTEDHCRTELVSIRSQLREIHSEQTIQIAELQGDHEAELRRLSDELVEARKELDHLKFLSPSRLADTPSKIGCRDMVFHEMCEDSILKTSQSVNGSVLSDIGASAGEPSLVRDITSSPTSLGKSAFAALPLNPLRVGLGSSEGPMAALSDPFKLSKLDFSFSSGDNSAVASLSFDGLSGSRFVAKSQSEIDLAPDVFSPRDTQEGRRESDGLLDSSADWAVGRGGTSGPAEAATWTLTFDDVTKSAPSLSDSPRESTRGGLPASRDKRSSISRLAGVDRGDVQRSSKYSKKKTSKPRTSLVAWSHEGDFPSPEIETQVQLCTSDVDSVEDRLTQGPPIENWLDDTLHSDQRSRQSSGLPSSNVSFESAEKCVQEVKDQMQQSRDKRRALETQLAGLTRQVYQTQDVIK